MSGPPDREFMAALAALIDEWCAQRRLAHLAAVLPSFIAFNGLTDGWAGLRDGLMAAVGLGPDGLPPAEWETLQRLGHMLSQLRAGP